MRILGLAKRGLLLSPRLANNEHRIGSIDCANNRVFAISLTATATK